MKKRSPLWTAAVLAFTVGIWLTAQPSSAADGDVPQSFSWGQVCVLIAVAAAWGDMRSQLREVRKEVDELRDKE